MIFFNTLIALIIILVFENVVARYNFPLFLYSTGVKGSLTCQFARTGKTFISISSRFSCKEERKPINHIYANYFKTFYIFGITRTIYKPHLYVKIVHNCTRFGQINYKKIFTKNIPGNFVQKGQRPKVFDLGIIELSQLPSILIKVPWKYYK